ncbi:uncharacterized protein LOC134541929 [Bacillus rossius redtenbacheri]|uniref:uncharacterized protein LOC134541929 n=1 Tax=Bacillus rossius redtenbacheri TaxID=93214 RepID=UPI002FDE38CC
MEAPRSSVCKVEKCCMLLAMLLLLLLAQQTSGRPSYQAEFPPDDIDYCKMNDEINVVCQRCAKMTQSKLVIPMCCSNEEQVLDWCERYINYGIQGR